jgi:hypothetical protein
MPGLRTPVSTRPTGTVPIPPISAGRNNKHGQRQRESSSQFDAQQLLCFCEFVYALYTSCRGRRRGRSDGRFGGMMASSTSNRMGPSEDKNTGHETTETESARRLR